MGLVWTPKTYIWGPAAPIPDDRLMKHQHQRGPSNSHYGFRQRRVLERHEAAGGNGLPARNVRAIQANEFCFAAIHLERIARSLH